MNLYFARTVHDETITENREYTSLYGGSYDFEEIQNLSSMSDDIRNKLSSIYGEVDHVEESTGWAGSKFTYYYWYGANDTV